MNKKIQYKIFDGLEDLTNIMGEFKTKEEAKDAALMADFSVGYNNYNKKSGEFHHVISYSKIELVAIVRPKTILRRSK